MAKIKNVSITPGGATTVLHVSQNDVGRVITVNMVDGEDYFDLTGSTATLAGIKPSTLGFSVTGTVSGHQVTFTTTKQMTDEDGVIECEIKVTKNSTEIGSANLLLKVEKDPHPESTTDGSADELISEITVLVERVEAAVAKQEVLQEAEAWGVGKRNGVDVVPGDPTYENNSKYYAGRAGTSATNAGEHAASALSSKQSAAASATDANQKKLDAEAAATAAAHSADLAASVFNVQGDVAVAVAQDGGVSLIFTEV